MKKLFFILLVLAACSEDEPQSEQKGCISGLTGGGDRVNIRCATRQEFLAGSNVNQGGTSNWTNYTKHEWKKVSNCSECN